MPGVPPSGKWGWREGVDWRQPGYEISDAHPVVCVSWNDAVAYTAWLSQADGASLPAPDRSGMGIRGAGGNDERTVLG